MVSGVEKAFSTVSPNANSSTKVVGGTASGTARGRRTMGVENTTKGNGCTARRTVVESTFFLGDLMTENGHGTGGTDEAV